MTIQRKVLWLALAMFIASFFVRCDVVEKRGMRRQCYAGLSCKPSVLSRSSSLPALRSVFRPWFGISNRSRSVRIGFKLPNGETVEYRGDVKTAIERTRGIVAKNYMLFPDIPAGQNADYDLLKQAMDETLVQAESIK